MTPAASSIDVHIEELVLEGFAPSDRDRMMTQVSDALGRILSERGLPGFERTAADRDVLDGGSFPRTAHGAGEDVAQAIYRVLVDA